MAETCTWCGAEVESGDGFRAYAEEGGAVFCRLEHVIPWVMQDGQWDQDQKEPAAEADLGERPERCSHCDAELGGDHVLLVRHRGEHRIADAFCSVDHMSDWAKAGGRWQ